MLRLDPEIREYVLSMPDTVRRPAITERPPRQLTKIDERREQLAVPIQPVSATVSASISAGVR